MSVKRWVVAIGSSFLITCFAVWSDPQLRIAGAESGEDQIDCAVLDCSPLDRQFEFNTDVSGYSIYSTASIRGVTGTYTQKSFQCNGGLKDPQCREATGITLSQSLTFCDKDLSYDCIETFETILESGEVISGKLIGSVNITPDKSEAIPGFGPFVPDNLVRFDFPNSETEFYQLIAPVSFSVPVVLGSSSAAGTPALNRLHEVIFSGGNLIINQINQFTKFGENENPYKCIPIDGFKCWGKVSDGKLRTFRTVMRRNKYGFNDRGWGVWKVAQLSNSKVAFKTLNGPRPETMTILASQVAVPGVSAKFQWNNKEQRREWTELNNALLPIERWESRPWCGGPIVAELQVCPQLRGTFVPETKLQYPNTMWMPDAFDLYRVLVATLPRFNTANKFTEQFSLIDQAPWNISWGNCEPGTSFGFSASNGLAVRNGLPSWDSSTKSINIEAVAPHFSSSGNVFQGTYSLVMQEALVRCLWGKNALELANVVISVYDDSGIQKTAVAASNFADGVFSFNASGFTYSTAKIEVKLKSQNAPAVAISKSTTARLLARYVKLNVALTSKVSLKVDSKSSKNCKIVGTALKVLENGSCFVSVTVTPKNGKAVTKTISLTVSK